MNAIPYDRPEEAWDSYEDEPETVLPGRPRRQLLSWWSAGLFALILGAVGFYVGVRVEKNQLASSTSSSAFSAAAGTGAAAATGAAARAGAGASAASRSDARGAAGGGAGGFRALFGGPGGAGGAALGTVSSVSGNSLVVTETSGNAVKVTLSSATKLTKNVTVGKKSVRPGDLVTVAGAKGANGTISATTLSDTGVSPAAAASGGSGGSSSAGSGSSAVNQLFGGG